MLAPVKSPPAEAVIDPDADLIFGLQAGDERALSGLMDRHMGAIYGLAFYMLGERMAAEDIAQTVFLKTWQHAQDWEPGRAKLLTWMQRVTKNACLDALKKKKPIYTDMVPEVQDTGNTPFEDISQSDTANAVARAMARLAPNQRAALTLSYYQGVSQREGAQIMKISESAYESLLVRARKAMKKYLDNGTLKAGHEKRA